MFFNLWIFTKSVKFDYDAKDPESLHCAFNAQGSLLLRRIYKEHRIELKELEPLKNIYLVRIGVKPEA